MLIILCKSPSILYKIIVENLKLLLIYLESFTDVINVKYQLLLF